MPDNCRQCGTCQRVCPVQKLGLPSFPGSWGNDMPSSKVWNCTNCWMCQEACPQDIDLWDIKVRAQRQTQPPPRVAAGIENLRTTGLALSFSQEINTRRREYGLEPVSLVAKHVLELLIREGTA